ncbi:ubinuclein-1 [Trichomycterus rosablanca]|uniref:ubinuclein-1 n=1 Tax=Trichomycterus rosablanca TaxID=2290929 RepID=UPI002F360F89
MATTRRIQLTTLANEDVVPPASESHAVQHLPNSSVLITPSESTKPDNVSSIRLDLVLFESDDLHCPEFYYSELIFKKMKDNLNTVCISQDKEKDELLVLAKKFEEKYGGDPNQRKDRLQDLVDIGFGYDESDSFIDNSEAYDELVPACLTTKLGGFYINFGTLQFRQALDEDQENETDDFEETIKPKKRKLKDGVEAKMNKKKKRREEKQNEKENVKNSVLTGKQPAEKKKKKANKELSIDGMLKKFHKEKIQQLEMFNLRGKEAPEIASCGPANQVKVAEESVPADPLLTLISSASAGDLLQAANTVDQDFDLDGLLSDDHNNGHPVMEKNQEASVVCQPVKSSCSLLDGLPSTLELSIQELAQGLKETEEGNKMEIFAPEINHVLLNMSFKSKELSDEVRSRTFSYLASQLSCKKATLVKRAKKLQLLQLDDQLRDLLQKLKDLVTSAMPEQIDHFNNSCQAFSKARAARLEAEREQKPIDGSDEEEEDKGGKRVFGPRKRFRWTAEIRELLSEAVKLKMSSYELEAPCSQTLEDHLKSFLEADVKTLWPKGWMQSRILLIESRKVHCHITGVMARKKSMTVPKAKKAQETNMKVQSVRTIKEPPGGSSLPELLQEDGEVEESTSVETISSEANSVVNTGTSLPEVPVASTTRHSLAGGKHEKLVLSVSPAKGECATGPGMAAMEASCGDPDLPTPSLSLQASSFYSNVPQTRVSVSSTPLHALPFPGEVYTGDPSEQTQTCKNSVLTSEAPGVLLCGFTQDEGEVHAELH